NLDLHVACDEVALLQHRGVGLFGFGVAAEREQQIAATKLGLVAVAASGVFCYQAVKGRERAPEIAGLVVGVRQLIEHAIVARIVRVTPQQVFVYPDRAAILTRDRAFGEPLPRPLDLEIAEAAHRLRTHAVGRRSLQELAVGLNGSGAAGFDRDVPLDDDLLLLEAAERDLLHGVRDGAGPEQAGDRRDDAALHGFFSVTRTA